MKTGLILSGGGARAAYQVGVVQAIAEMMPKQRRSPFKIICGTSAGAINAAKLACDSDRFHDSVTELAAIWENLSSEQVHNVGFMELFLSTMKLLGSFFHSGVVVGKPLSLLDNSPLEETLRRTIPMQRLPRLIKLGFLDALSINTLGYDSGQNISFFEGSPELANWRRAQRLGVRAKLDYRHLMASSALPAIFPSVKINREYFGDGAIRQTTPLSAALHLGAEQLLVIGVSGNTSETPPLRHGEVHSPSLAQMLAQLLNSAFIDSMEEDLDMLQRFNRITEYLSEEEQQRLNLRKVDVFTIQPSIPFDILAGDHVHDLPFSMRTMLRTIGATKDGGGSSLASYVLFESGYCKALMHEGYRDAMRQKDELLEFMLRKKTD